MQDLIYVVDDELHIRQLLLLGLSEQNFSVCAFEDGQSFLRALEQGLPGAVVLDWMMPQPDGAALCALLRQDPHTRAIPIVMLTARGSEMDRVRGLELGADDYMSKPFSIKELAARLRALLRRGEYLAAQQPVAKRLLVGDVALDSDARKVYAGQQELALTMREFDLLQALLKNMGRVLTREVLLDTVWGWEYCGDTRTVDVHIRYLRQKLACSKEICIETVRGVGYRLALRTGEQHA